MLPAEAKDQNATSWSKVVSTGMEAEESTGSGSQQPAGHLSEQSTEDRSVYQESRVPDLKSSRSRPSGNGRSHERSERSRDRDPSSRHIHNGRGRNNSDWNGNGNRNQRRQNGNRKFNGNRQRRDYDRNYDIDPKLSFFIKSIPADINEDKLRNLLEAFGQVKNLELRERKSGDDRRYAFLSYVTCDSERLLGKSPLPLDGRYISVERHRTQIRRDYHKKSYNSYNGRRRDSDRARNNTKHKAHLEEGPLPG